MYCPICDRDTAFSVYDSVDQGMCMNCGTILFEFSLMEEAKEINRRLKNTGGNVNEIKS